MKLPLKEYVNISEINDLAFRLAEIDPMKTKTETRFSKTITQKFTPIKPAAHWGIIAELNLRNKAHDTD